MRVDHLAERALAAERLDLFSVLVALVHAELPDLEPRALVDDDGDLDPLAVGREHDPRGADLHHHVALVVIKGVQEEDVALEGVLAVRAAGAEAQDRALAGLHLLAQLGVGDAVVADERDAANGDRLVLGDLELDDDLVVALRVDREVDVGEEVPLLGVRVLDLLHAAADGRDAQDRVRLDLDRFLKLVVLDLFVAFELDALDVRPLADQKAQVDAAVALVRSTSMSSKKPESQRARTSAVSASTLKICPGLRRRYVEDVVFGDAPIAAELDRGDRLTVGPLGFGLRNSNLDGWFDDAALGGTSPPASTSHRRRPRVAVRLEVGTGRRPLGPRVAGIEVPARPGRPRSPQAGHVATPRVGERARTGAPPSGAAAHARDGLRPESSDPKTAPRAGRRERRPAWAPGVGWGRIGARGIRKVQGSGERSYRSTTPSVKRCRPDPDQRGPPRPDERRNKGAARQAQHRVLPSARDRRRSRRARGDQRSPSRWMAKIDSAMALARSPTGTRGGPRR